MDAKECRKRSKAAEAAQRVRHHCPICEGDEPSFLARFVIDVAQGLALGLALGCVLYACDARAQKVPAAQTAEGVALIPSPANGPAVGVQPSAAGRIANDETALALAITYVAEAGWDAERDHAAISHVLKRKADRHSLPLIDVLVRYIASRRVHDARRPWLYQLRLDATKPASWPRSLSWAAHVDRWLACVERARAFLRGELPDPCGAEHWGGVMDVPRGRMQIAACSGLTHNVFYTVMAR